MTTASLYAFFSDPKAIREAFRSLASKGARAKADLLAHIELPLRFSVIGVPIAGLGLTVLGYLWFGIHPVLGALAVPLVFVFSLIAVSATGLTGITPVGALANLTQLVFGLLSPGFKTTDLIAAQATGSATTLLTATNVVAGGITAEVSSNAANLLMDIKPGYMLGAKPRQQAVGHLLGAFSGLVLSVPVWYFVFIQGDISRYGTDRIPVPSALQWRAVAKLLNGGLKTLDPTMQEAVVSAVIVGALVGLVVEISRHVTKSRFPLSAMGLGLSFVLSFHDVWAMFLGSLLFWALGQKTARWKNAHEIGRPVAPGEGEAAPEAPAPPSAPAAPKPWYARASENTETLCGGVIAGGALMGIALNVLDVLVFPKLGLEPKELRAFAPVIKHAVEALGR
jgi:uncharacterized oligopeptide transporter (OPT) family protein